MAAHALPALLLLVAILAGTTHALVVNNLMEVPIKVSVNDGTAVTINPGLTATIPNTTGLTGTLTSVVVTTADSTYALPTSVITTMLSTVPMSHMTLDVGAATCLVDSVSGITGSFNIAVILALFATCLGQVAP